MTDQVMSAAKAPAREKRTLSQVGSGVGLALVLTWTYNKITHDVMPAEVAIAIVGLITSAAAFVMNRTAWGRKVFAS
mgnify:CR=1 FL=1